MPITSSGWPLLRRLIGNSRRSLAIGILGGIGWQASGIVVPIAIGWVVDNGIRASDKRSIWIGVLVIIVIGIIEGIGGALRHRGACLAHEAGKLSLRKSIVEVAIDDNPGNAGELSAGELLGRSTGDVDQVGIFLEVLPHTVAQLCSVPTVVIVLALIDPQLGLLIAAATPVLILVMWRQSLMWREPTAAVREAFDSVTTAGEELVEGFRVTAGLGVGDTMAARYTRQSELLRDESHKRARLWLVFEPAVEVLSFISVAIVLWFGGQSSIDGQLDVGELVAAVGLAVFLSGPIRNLGQRIVTLQMALVSARRIEWVIGQQGGVPANSGGRIVPSSSSASQLAPVGTADSFDIASKDVVFRAGASDESRKFELALENLKVVPGQVVLLHGPVGSGKTLLLGLLAGEIAPSSGSIELAGVDIGDWGRAARRSRILRVGPAPFLFAGTIADNVRFGRPSASDVEVFQALEMAEALEFVEQQPAGIDSAIGERGISLSGGQRQRIAIARALLADPRILMLDGATSAVNPDIEQSILNSIKKSAAERILVIVSANPDVSSLADRTLRIDSGRVVVN